MKVKQSKKKNLLVVFVVSLLLVLGLGMYAVRSVRIDDMNLWQLDDPEISDEEQEALTFGYESPSINAINTANAAAFSAKKQSKSKGLLGQGGGESDSVMTTPNWCDEVDGPVQPGWKTLAACGSKDEVKGGCVAMNVSTSTKGGGSCQALRKVTPELTRDYGISTAGISEAGCRGAAAMVRSWKNALLGPECQPGLLYNQKSITSDVFQNKYTGKSSPKQINISHMHTCMPGNAGRKHPTFTKGNETLYMDPGHPDKVITNGGNSTAPSKVPDKGMQTNIDAYRDAGYTVTWEAYDVVPKAACECRTEREINIPTSEGKLIKYCAKTGPAQVKLEGATPCSQSNKPMFCCPAGKNPSNGKCV